MNKNTNVLKIAQKYIGKGGALFREFCGLPSGAAWCNAFVDYVADEGDVASLYFDGKKETFCPDSIKWCRQNLTQIPLFLAMPMDIIYFDWELNGDPNHIGFVRKRKSTKEIYTIEGNTDGGKVAEKTRTAKYVQAVYRPHYRGDFKLQKLSVDGDCGYNTIANLQKAIGGCSIDGVLGQKTVKRMQEYLAIKQDGVWGVKTSKAVQKLIGAKQDGQFGKESVKALQKWINKKLYKEPVKTKSYKIAVDLTNQICTVYAVQTDETLRPIMSEWVSTARKGKNTPVGNWKIQGWGGRKAKYRTALMSSGKAYAEYLVRFKGPKCMHTVPYKTRNTKGYVNKNEFNKLGTPRSAGCVRMPYKMAKFIYTKCPIGTPVVVFKGREGDYPMGIPVKYVATTNVDPTK